MDIQSITASIKAKGMQWVAMKNEISVLDATARRLLLGCVQGEGEVSTEELEVVARANLEYFTASLKAAKVSVTTLPSRFDLRNVNGQNFITPIKKQLDCGSCVAFGVLAAVEGAMRYPGNPSFEPDLSEADLFFCLAAKQGRTCSTGWNIPAALSCVQAPGVVDEACYPYNLSQQGCSFLCPNASGRKQKISSYKKYTTITDMQKALNDDGPLVTMFNVYDDFFSYSSGVYEYSTGPLAGGHCVCCVGYDDENRCWIMKNSWGPGWGEQGFFRIRYGQCGIDAAMYSVHPR